MAKFDFRGVSQEERERQAREWAAQNLRNDAGLQELLQGLGVKPAPGPVATPAVRDPLGVPPGAMPTWESMDDPIVEELLRREAAGDSAAVSPQTQGTGTFPSEDAQRAAEDAADEEEARQNEARYARQEAEREAEARANLPPQETGETAPPVDPMYDLQLRDPEARTYQERSFGDIYRGIRTAQTEMTPPPAPAAPINPTPPSEEAPFSRRALIEQAGNAYAAETARRDPENQFYAGAQDRQAHYAPDRNQRAPLYTQNLSEDALDELAQKGLVTDAKTRPGLASTGLDPSRNANPYGVSETPWEDEFTRDREPFSDSQIRGRAAAIGIFGGERAAEAFRTRELKNREDYRKGLYEARGHDRADQRIPQALAEGIAATGNFSPEAVANLKMSDPVVQAYVNGMYGQGAAAERAQRQFEQMMIALGATNQRHADTIEAQKDVAATHEAGAITREGMRGDTQKDVATTRAQGKVGAQPDEATQQQTVINHLQGAQSLGLSRQQAEAVVRRGDYSAIPEERRDEVHRKMTDAMALAQTWTGLRQLTAARAVDAKIPEESMRATQLAIARAKGDTKFALAFENSWEDARRDYQRASYGWKQMSPNEKEAFVQWSASGFTGEIPKAILGEHQKYAGAIQKMINVVVKERAGSAVTHSEWERIAQELGIATGDFSPFSNGDGITSFLSNARQRLEAHRSKYESYMGGWGKR